MSRVQCDQVQRACTRQSDRCRVRIEECLRSTPQGAERLDRRSEVISEALAEEIQGGEQRRERSGRVTTTAPAPNLAASTSHELRENPIEPDPNPNKRLLMKSASSAASGSGQQRVMRSATDTVPEALIGVPMEIILTKVQYCPALWQRTPDEKLLRSQLQQQLPNKRELTVTVKKQCGSRALSASNWESCQHGSCAQMGRQSNFSGRASLGKADGKNLKIHCHLTVDQLKYIDVGGMRVVTVDTNREV